MALIQVNYIYTHTYIAWYLREYNPSLSHHFPIFPQPHLQRTARASRRTATPHRAAGDVRRAVAMCRWPRWLPTSKTVPGARRAEVRLFVDGQCVGQKHGVDFVPNQKRPMRTGEPGNRGRISASRIPMEDPIHLLWELPLTARIGAGRSLPQIHVLFDGMLQEHVPIMCQFYLWSIAKRQLFGNFHTNRIMNHSVNCWHEQWGQKIPWQDTSSMEKFRTLNFSKFWTEKDECGMQNEEGTGMNGGYMIFRNI